MKRTPMTRKTPLRQGKPLAAVGRGAVKRKARTAKARQSSHSRQWREDVKNRDGHRCTAIYVGDSWMPMARTFAVEGDPGVVMWEGVAMPLVGYRCKWSIGDTEKPGEVHHRTSSRMGAERLEDGCLLCPTDHPLIEAQIRPHRRRA